MYKGNLNGRYAMIHGTIGKLSISKHIDISANTSYGLSLFFCSNSKYMDGAPAVDKFNYKYSYYLASKTELLSNNLDSLLMGQDVFLMENKTRYNIKAKCINYA